MSTTRHVLSEYAAKRLLAEFDVASNPAREATTPNEAADAAERLGFPVVLKVSHPDLPHKSDIDGVALDIQTVDETREVAARLLALRDGAKVLVERQAPAGGVELIVGAKRDPIFGPTVLVGLGGIFAEVLHDVALHAGELDADQARGLLASLRGYPLLTGARGRPAVDLAAIVRVLTAVSQLVVAHPEIVELDINPLRVYAAGALALDALAVVDREVVAPLPVDLSDAAARVAPFFAPQTVAVVGASATAEKAGNIILKNLETFGYQGTVYPVHRDGKAVEGLTSYRTVADCPTPPDLVVVAVPQSQVMPVLRDAARAGVRHAIVASGGFGDAGAAGRARQDDLLAFCREADLHLLGPNSIGTIDTTSGFVTSIGKLPPMPRGTAALVGQTGTFSTGFALEEITVHGRGFSKIACLGNKADVNETDFLAYLADDPSTRAIGLYLEGVADGPRFAAALERAAKAKPVVIVKSGRSELGAQAAASHTGSLAGADAVYDALFRQVGAMRVDGLHELTDTLRGLTLCPKPAGPRVGVVSITGVGCVLAVDACEELGLTLASIGDNTKAALQALAPEWMPLTNPADIWSTIEQRGPFAAYQESCRAMLNDPQVDILLVVGVLLEEGHFDTAAALAPLCEAFPAKPILACHLGGRADLLDAFSRGLEQVGVPVYAGPRRALTVAARLVQIA